MSSSFEDLEPRLRNARDCFNCDWLHLVGDMTPAEIAKVRKLALELSGELSSFVDYLTDLRPREKRARLPWQRD